MHAVTRSGAGVLVALACWLSGGGGATAHAMNDVVTARPDTTASPVSAVSDVSAGPLGSDSRESVITAAAAGLALGGVIAFWQSRRHRRRDSPRDDPRDPRPTDDDGRTSTP